MMPDRDETAKAFATELVQLARKHGANNLRMTFDMTGDTQDWQERTRWDRGPIELVWANGRHGAKNNIHLSYQSTVNLVEEPTS